MKATVNESCIGCGLCCGICPQVFAMGEDGTAHAAALDEALLPAAREARDSCPVSAIELEE